MIPFVAKVGVRIRSRAFRLWIPLALIWLLLLPVALLAFVPVCFLCLIGRVNPAHVVPVSWQILCGMKGSEVEIALGNASLSVDVF